MERFINVAGAQTGPIARNESRQQVVSRLLELMREAKARGSDIVVFPELALTTFFPRWWMEDDAEIDSFFEREMPSRGHHAAVREPRRSSRSVSISATRNSRSTTARRIATTPRSSSTRTPGSSANTGRCICRATPITARTIRFSIWRSDISSRATWAFRYGAHSAPMSACASAMTGAGRRPIGSWVCRASS